MQIACPACKAPYPQSLVCNILTLAVREKLVQYYRVRCVCGSQITSRTV
jgi:hypothetical protein